MRLPILENARIASPCNVPWASMQGDDCTRHCDQCDKRVYNLVGLSNEEVARLFEQRGHDLCIQLYQRSDGTLLTGDCPVGLRAARRRLRRAMTALGAAATFLLTAGLVRGQFGGQTRSVRSLSPYSRIVQWLSPAPVITPATRVVRGRVRFTRPGFVKPPNGSNTCGNSDNGGDS